MQGSGDATMEHADRLIDNGDYLGAVDWLTSANRSTHDPEAEARLVRLRHEAYVRTEHEPRDAVILPTAERPSPEIPERTPEELTIEQLRADMSAYGCVLVRGLVSPERCQEMKEGVDRALAAYDAATADEDAEQDPAWYTPFKPMKGDWRLGARQWMRASGGVWAVDSPRMMFELTELLAETGVAALAEEFFGERPVLSANKCNLRKVPPDTATNWHQDGAFLGTDVESLNLWLALSDCGVDSPGLDMVPRRIGHIIETGTEGAWFDWSIAPDKVDAAAGDTEVIRPPFNTGDALLFDHYFVHRTGVSEDMDQYRYAIEAWLFARSAYPGGQIPVCY